MKVDRSSAEGRPATPIDAVADRASSARVVFGRPVFAAADDAGEE